MTYFIYFLKLCSKLKYPKNLIIFLIFPQILIESFFRRYDCKIYKFEQFENHTLIKKLILFTQNLGMGILTDCGTFVIELIKNPLFVCYFSRELLLIVKLPILFFSKGFWALFWMLVFMKDFPLWYPLPPSYSKS